MQRVSQWRAGRTGELRDPGTGANPASQSGNPLRKTIEVNPLKSSETNATSVSGKLGTINTEKKAASLPPPSPSNILDWRAHVKEKVRQAKEGRTTSLSNKVSRTTDATQKTVRGHLVASALKRLQKTDEPELNTPPRSVGATAPKLNIPDPVLVPSPAQKKLERELPGEHQKPQTSGLTSRPIPASQPPRVQSKPGFKFRISPEVKNQITSTTANQAMFDSPIIDTDIELNNTIKYPSTQVLGLNQDDADDMLVQHTHLYTASPWVRVLAGAWDINLVFLAYLPIFAAYAALKTSVGFESLFILAMLLAATVFAYQIVTLGIADRTLGMALINVRLINTDDETIHITFRQKLLRAWAATIAFLFPPLNIVIMRINRGGLSLPDLVSGTSPVEE